MKKLILFQVCLSMAISGFSQGPVLTMQNSGPVPGDCFRSYVADTTGVAVGDSGANMTWDYSALQIGREMSFEIYEDTTYSLYGHFPEVTTVYHEGLRYYYMNITDSAYIKIGEAYFPGPIYMGPAYFLKYSDWATILRYPMSYPRSFTDHYAASSTGYIETVFREGVTSTKADGYGKLILPFATINNVVRIKITSDEKDSVMWFSGPDTATTYITHMEKYLWYDGISKTPVLKIEKQGILPSTYCSTSVWVAAWMEGTGDRNSCKPVFSVYPSPASNNLNVSFILAGQTDVSFALLTVTGNELLRVPAEGLSPGNHMKQIDIPGIPGGMYILKCTAGKESTFCKVLVK